jgi:hypothetical protein
MTMRKHFLSSKVFCTLVLLGSAATAPAAATERREAVALWLSQQLHRPVEASQILLSPETTALEGCTIARYRPVPIGGTALSLRCPAHALPQLLLLNFSVQAAGADPPASRRAALPPNLQRKISPIVRAGAALQADWRTDALHAELPVVALDSGAAGAEIRVRIASTNRIMRARILTAHTVTIIVAGA